MMIHSCFWTHQRRTRILYVHGIEKRHEISPQKNKEYLPDIGLAGNKTLCMIKGIMSLFEHFLKTYTGYTIKSVLSVHVQLVLNV